MDRKRFQVLVAQLSDLSGVQRAALITALKRRLPADEALQLIDSHFLADPCCGHCRSKNAGGWSAQGGLKRYRCKDCGKTFNALTGTPLAQLHRRDAWFAYAQALADGVSLEEGGQALRDRTRHLVPLAPPLPGRCQGRESQGGEGHR